MREPIMARLQCRIGDPIMQGGRRLASAVNWWVEMVTLKEIQKGTHTSLDLYRSILEEGD